MGFGEQNVKHQRIHVIFRMPICCTVHAYLFHNGTLRMTYFLIDIRYVLVKKIRKVFSGAVRTLK